ncbi:MAG TPA: TetR family transcriptional regulator, partial [Mycobacterium sp.]|nr:TetR family transcriptional regulator [Mycobacterium sp.]
AEADAPDRPPVERLTAVVTAYVKWHADNHQRARVVQYELRSLSAPNLEVVARLRRATSGVFKTIVEAGRASGDFSVVDVDTTVLAITALGVDVSRWFPTRKYSDPAALAVKYSQLTTMMVGATRARGRGR